MKLRHKWREVEKARTDAFVGLDPLRGGVEGGGGGEKTGGGLVREEEA